MYLDTRDKKHQAKEEAVPLNICITQTNKKRRPNLKTGIKKYWTFYPNIAHVSIVSASLFVHTIFISYVSFIKPNDSNVNT
jgi:hypothetical protein